MRKVTRLVVVLLVGGLAVGYAEEKEPTSEKRSKIALIELNGTVDELMFTSLKRRVKAAKRAGAEKFILSLTTYGGYLQNADKIIDFIGGQKEEIVSYVKERALSAGTLVALGCSRIYLSPESIIGDCGPILPGGVVMSEDEKAKAVSYVAERLRQLARKGGYSEAVAVAMADSELVLYSLTITKDSEERLVVVEEERLKEEIERWEGEGWAVVSQTLVKEKGRFLTLTAPQAVKFNFCSGVVESEERLAEMLGYHSSAILRVELNWWEKFAWYISSSPPILFLLLTLGGILLYLELKTPGFGLPGTLGIIFLFVALFSAYLGHLASVIEIMMILAGVILILLEIFVIPGFGLPGIAGILLLLSGLILAFQEFTFPRSVFEVEVLKTNFAVVFGSIVVLGIGIA
ncbi:MAG: hypothetical protein N2234_10380, partial [Planctomycetota bacterium]|nr:hypothetical protein [Planctomycetota bacterium]